MSSGIYSARTDAPFRAVGVGMAPLRSCMGCHTPRHTAGGQGAGVRWRCMHCVAAKQGKGG